jgi:tight adherence protein C
VTAALMAGAAAGAGMFLLVWALIPQRRSLAQQLAAFDAGRADAAARPVGGGVTRNTESEFSRRLGAPLAAFCAEQGWQFLSLRASLSLVGKSFESYLTTKVLLAILGFLLAPLAFVALPAAGIHVSVVVPVSMGVIVAVIFFFLPDLELKQKAEQRRRDFRHAVGAFLDLVSMNLSGGRGVPEALMAASEIGQGWAMWRIRDALANARITGQTPWQALGALGDEIRLTELRDLSAALGLVADDGAKVRQSLTARAASLRRREVAELEGEAGEKSQVMLVAQMLMCAGFMVFLAYPAIRILLGF